MSPAGTDKTGTANMSTDKTAAVTGAASGIGHAACRRLLEAGWTVFGLDVAEPRLDAVRDGFAVFQNRFRPIVCDVADAGSVTAAFAGIGDTLNALVCCAGVLRTSLLENMPIEDFDLVLNTNLRGVYYAIRSLAPLMIRARSGHIINISSIAGKNALPDGAAYAASKWGLNGLSYSVAEELRGRNIRVSVICPGSTNTDLSPHEGKDPSKMLQPEDIARAVAMLVTQSPRSFVSEMILRPTQKP